MMIYQKLIMNNSFIFIILIITNVLSCSDIIVGQRIVDKNKGKP